MRRFLTLTTILVASSVTALPGFAQGVGGPVRVVDVTPASSVPFGERFDLVVTIRLGPDVSVALPDSLPASPVVEPAGVAVLGTPVPGPGDSLDVVVAFPALALLEGAVGLSDLSATVTPSNRGAGEVASTDRVRLEGEASRPPGAARIPLRLGTITVARFAALDSVEGTARPRAPADVLGASWSPWDLLFVVALAGGLFALMVPRVAPRPGSRESPSRGLDRPAALDELDRILGQGWHRRGRLPEFYSATTDVLRRRLFHEEADWGPWLTSRELTHRLADRWGADGAGEVQRAVHEGERVRFSAHRTSASAAEDDWATIRAWIADASASGGVEAPVSGREQAGST